MTVCGWGAIRLEGHGLPRLHPALSNPLGQPPGSPRAPRRASSLSRYSTARVTAPPGAHISGVPWQSCTRTPSCAMPSPSVSTHNPPSLPSHRAPPSFSRGARLSPTIPYGHPPKRAATAAAAPACPCGCDSLSVSYFELLSNSCFDSTSYPAAPDLLIADYLARRSTSNWSLNRTA
jgi:hypothetical protein